LAEVLELFFWCPTLVLALGIVICVGKGAFPLVGQLGVGTAGGFFSFSAFLGLMAFHYKWELWCGLIW
jgi:hypothetical protein